jgi:hypothetical protein
VSIPEDEDDDDLGCRCCPVGFDGFGFGDFVNYRTGRLVEAYFWRGGGVTWIAKDTALYERTPSGNCSLRSFRSNHSRANAARGLPPPSGRER